MATCKDCVYHKMCRFCDSGTSDIFIMSNNAEKLCPDFKHKDRIIELPCKVGDMFFEIGYHYTLEVCEKCADYNGWEYDCLKDYRLFPEIDETDICPNHKLSILVREFSVDLYDFVVREIGKTVFLTKEEAEQKLKELNENEQINN